MFSKLSAAKASESVFMCVRYESTLASIFQKMFVAAAVAVVERISIKKYVLPLLSLDFSLLTLT